MRILLVTPYLPHPQVEHGGGQAIRGLLRALGRRHECLVVSLLRPGEDHLVAATAAQGFQLRTVPFLDQRATGWHRLRLAGDRVLALGRVCRDRYPYYVAKYRQRALCQAVTAAARDFEPAVIQVEYLQLGYLLRDLRRWLAAQPATAARGSAPAPRLILSSHEMSSLPRRRRAAQASWLGRHWLLAAANAWDRLARDASGWADATLCVTDQDRALLAAAGGRRLVTVPLGIEPVPAPAGPPSTGPPRILFLGSFQHQPNRSAATLLCERIWPQASPQLAGWELVLAGAGSDTFLASGPGPVPGVRALGFVADLAALLHGSRLLAAPLTEGGGIKIKILEAMAHGLPVVTTPIGAEGIVSRQDDLVWWADDPARFTEVLVAAAQDPAGSAARAERARMHVERCFGWEAVVRRLEAVYRGDVDDQSAAGGPSG